MNSRQLLAISLLVIAVFIAGDRVGNCLGEKKGAERTAREFRASLHILHSLARPRPHLYTAELRLFEMWPENVYVPGAPSHAIPGGTYVELSSPIRTIGSLDESDATYLALWPDGSLRFCKKTPFNAFLPPVGRLKHRFD